jgi:hypothetical protein
MMARCKLNDFTITGEWNTEILENGQILETASAKTEESRLKLDGVVYRVDGKLKGFVGSAEGAKWWAERDAGIYRCGECGMRMEKNGNALCGNCQKRNKQ